MGKGPVHFRAARRRKWFGCDRPRTSGADRARPRSSGRKYSGGIAQGDYSAATELAARVRSAPLSRQSRSETGCTEHCRFSRCHAGALNFIQRYFALRQGGKRDSRNSGIAFVEMVECARRVAHSIGSNVLCLLSSVQKLALKFRDYCFGPFRSSISRGSFLTSNNRYASPSRFSISFQSRSRYIVSSANSEIANRRCSIF